MSNALIGNPITQLTYSATGLFVGPTGLQTATIPQGSVYQPTMTNEPLLNQPFPMGIVVTRDQTMYPTSELYTLDLAIVDDTQSAEMSFQVLIEQPTLKTFQATVSPLGSGFCSVQVLQTTEDFAFILTFDANTPSIFLPGSFDNRDTYAIFPGGDFIGVFFSRYVQGTTNNLFNQTGLTNLTDLTSLMSHSVLQPHALNPHGPVLHTSSTLVSIPTITILGQTTTLYGDNLSDYTFSVQDDRCYKNGCHAKIGCNECHERLVDSCKTKTTSFYKYRPPLFDVVKGKGKTLRDKAMYLYTKFQPQTGPSFQQFYNQLIYYGMLKYFLGRLLYGEFDIKVLCSNFNQQLMADTQHSRFCAYYDYLINPDNGYIVFEQYFIKCA